MGTTVARPEGTEGRGELRKTPTTPITPFGACHPSTSYATFLALMGYLVLLKLLITYVFSPDVFAHPSQRETFEWPFLGILTAAGLVGVWLAGRTGFPAMWDPAVSTKQRFLIPALLGMGFGLLGIAVDQATGLTRIVAEEMKIPVFNMPFPASAFVYPGGAVIMDVILRLVPLPLAVWLISNLALRGRWQAPVFWSAAVLLSGVEVAMQTGILNPLRGKNLPFPDHRLLWGYMVANDYVFNLLQAYLFRRYGFLSSLTMRVSMYLFWHVLWGLCLQASHGFS